jgi:hypothetical protein
MLRAELESVNAQLEMQDAAKAADSPPAEGVGATSAGADDEDLQTDLPEADTGPDDEKQQMEIKIQELEALVEFKDAAIEELEKQYNTLESKYRALKEQA